MRLLHHILDARARETPDAVAVRAPGVAWTYAELRERSRRCAGWLRARGVGRGDRVLVCAPHAPETVVAIFAASRLGALYVIAGERLPAPAFEHLVRDCEPRVVVTDAAELAGADADPADDEERCISADPVSLIYTSGSTSRPKAVVSTHAQVRFAATAIQSQLAYRPDDVVFCCLPLSFDYGLYQAFLACLSGATLCLGDGADAGPALLGRLIEYDVSILPAVPSLATNLALLLRRSQKRPRALRLVTNTGAHLAPALAAELRELLPGLAVVAMFGLTECKRVSIMTPDGDLDRPGAVGRPLPDTEAYVVDSRGRRLPPGEVGELVVRGPHVMCGYWRAPALTAQRFRRDELGQPLLYTGDRCRVDADGYLYFVGRSDDIYKHWGFRVSAVEVEAAALAIPGVHHAAVVPPNGADAVRLAVAGDVTEGDVLEALADTLEPFKVPDECVVLDALPLGATGKVDRVALAALR